MSKTERFRSVVLIGPPGVGKGTQGKILGIIPGFFHLSSGDVFRAVDISSPEGKEISTYLSRGQLVPDEVTIRIWRRALDGNILLNYFKPWEDLLILDGIPRTVNQVKLLEDHVEVTHVVHLVCADEEDMVRRIKRRAIRENRADDVKEEVIRSRFEVYRQETAPVLDCFPPEIISQVESSGSPAEVLRKVLNCVIPPQNEGFFDGIGEGDSASARQ
ncbi:MAG: nucleoside monophosphate kinase [Planctomycetota bacterium]|nr:nucleoside monophosphate kinase [Planctomycetota bacterium]